MYRVLARSEEGIELVREYTPCRRTIKFFDEYNTLNFPYVIFLNKGYNTFVAFSPKPIKHKLDYLYMPPMGNIYEGWSVCGCETDIAKVHLYSRTDRLKKGIEKFWQSKFSTDGWGHKLLLDTFKEAYLEWSIKTPEEVLKEIQYENDILEVYNDDDYNKIKIRKTFKDFLDSDVRSVVECRDRLQMLPVREITLDSEYEQIKFAGIEKTY